MAISGKSFQNINGMTTFALSLNQYQQRLDKFKIIFTLMSLYIFVESTKQPKSTDFEYIKKCSFARKDFEKI